MTASKWEIEFFETRSGRCPTQEFLDSLEAKELVFATHGMERLETYGPTLRRPHVDYLRDNIYKLRVRVSGGNLRFFYFFFDGRKIVITHAIKKKNAQVPPKEIDRAIAYRDEYLRRSR